MAETSFVASLDELEILVARLRASTKKDTRGFTDISDAVEIRVQDDGEIRFTTTDGYKLSTLTIGERPHGRMSYPNWRQVLPAVAPVMAVKFERPSLLKTLSNMKPERKHEDHVIFRIQEGAVSIAAGDMTANIGAAEILATAGETTAMAVKIDRGFVMGILKAMISPWVILEFRDPMQAVSIAPWGFTYCKQDLPDEPSVPTQRAQRPDNHTIVMPVRL